MSQVRKKADSNRSLCNAYLWDNVHVWLGLSSSLVSTILGAENIPELSGINIYQVFNVWSYMTKTSNNCPTQWICKDDEAYHNSDFPLPPINQLRPTRADFKVG